MEGEVDKSCSLVFPTAGCQSEAGFSRLLKAARNVRSSSRMTSGFTSFARRSRRGRLWAGVDLRTVQQWLGHSDMESTMRYLKPSRSQQVREKVNEIFA